MITSNRAMFAPSMLATLSPAERLVAVHVAQGMSNKEIASLLGKAEPTVKHQVSSVLRSANVQSRCQFIALYYQQFFCILADDPDGAWYSIPCVLGEPAAAAGRMNPGSGKFLQEKAGN